MKITNSPQFEIDKSLLNKPVKIYRKPFARVTSQMDKFEDTEFYGFVKSIEPFHIWLVTPQKKEVRIDVQDVVDENIRIITLMESEV